MFKKVVYIICGLFIVASFVAAAGFGICSYTLNKQLTQTRVDYQALKAENAKVTSDYKQAQADLKDTQAKLEDAEAQVEKLQGDLKKAQDQNKSLKKEIVTIQEKVDILNAFWFSSEANFKQKVDASSDTELYNLYIAAKNAKTSQESNIAFVDLMDYMINSIVNVVGEYQVAFIFNS
jgi:peptidoglycan hydrolase CwlO-like protein